MELILLLWLSTIFVSGWLANKKGYSAFEGVLWAIFIGPLEILVILFIWKDKGSKKCPQCAEMIKKEAKVCRFCGYKFESVQIQSETGDIKTVGINNKKYQEDKKNISNKLNKKYVAIFILLLMGVFISGYYYRYKIIYFVVDKVYDKLSYIGIELPYKIQLGDILVNKVKEYYSLGRLNQDNKKHDEAIENYTKAIQIYPKFIEAYDFRGLSYYIKGKYDNAIKDFNKVIEYSPNNGMCYMERGAAYYLKGLSDEAIKDFNKAIELSQTLKNNDNLAYVYYLRGCANEKKRLTFEAKRDLKTSADLGSSDAKRDLKMLYNIDY
ncbi:MAG: hypothetical protein A2539_06010 [Elusimicrobia bacterium RIFOXYD2_FULL_34_15]|nr:MAG: hypothetical protein A2539_06010 [Elusimicrobia bacterium RIFOXYD2_FULL_34_15]